MSSNADYDAIIQTLSRAKRILITTHVKPDGDALGSTAAMSMALRERGIVSHVLLLSKLPGKYAFIYKDNGISFSDADPIPADFALASYDALLVIDTGTWSQLPGLREKVAGFGGTKIVLDHHLTQESWADQKLVDTQAGAAGEIVAGLLERWGVSLTEPMAMALFLAIVSDTGWFAFSSTRPCTLRLAARLLEAGVDHDLIYQRLYQSERPQRLALQSRAMQGLQLVADNRVGVLSLSRQDFQTTGATVNDTENLVNLPLQIATVQASILLVEPLEPGPIRISLRSKGQIDVAKFSEGFGGGGHARAAGLKISDSLEKAKEMVVTSITRSLV